MDAWHQPHSCRGGGPRLPGVALVASLLLHLCLLSPASGAPLARLSETRCSPRPRLDRRVEGEHVILADCKAGDDLTATLSSQMAYFTGAPGPSPRDVAVIATNPGETALWANSNTTGFFTTSSVTFTANLGPRVDEGQFAGTGNNGYGDFSCYQRYVKNLYKYGNNVCSQVYLCDHSHPPPGGGSKSSSSMSQGTIIGIAVGVVGGVLFLVATGLVIWYLRRSRRAQAARTITASERMSATLSPGSEFAELKAQSPAVEAAAMHEIYEMDGRPLRSEMADDTGKVELDPSGHGNAELDPAAAKGQGPSSAATENTDLKVVSPVSPPVLDSPPGTQPPKSPPPEYASNSSPAAAALAGANSLSSTRSGMKWVLKNRNTSPLTPRKSPNLQPNWDMQPPPAPRAAIRPLLVLVGLVNLAWSLYQLPVSRVVESRLCREHYAAHDPSVLHPDGSVSEELCKIDDVQRRLGRIQGVIEALWVAGDFVMTIPLVSLADQYGYRAVLRLNLIPRIFLLAWTFAVGYFDRLPINAILAAPTLSFLGGDCVFNSIVYSLVSELTDDHVLRATFFGYVNAVSSIFSLQLGPAIAAASMSSLLWRPLWIGIVLLLLAIPLIYTLPSSSSTNPKLHPPSADEGDALIPRPAHNLKSTTARRFRTVLSLLANPTRNFLLLLSVFFLSSLASSDTKLLPLTAENIANAHICLVFSVLGALAIAVSPAIWALVAALLVYALGIALPMFTYSLLKAAGTGLEHHQREDASGMQLFSAVMLVRTVGTLVGAVVMPSLWVAALGAGGWALGLPQFASILKRTGYDLCDADCKLNGVPFPDKHTLQLPLDNYRSEQCPGIFVGDASAPTATSRVCLDFVGTNLYFNFSSFPGYTYKKASVTWKQKGNALTQDAWTLPPPDKSISCGPNPSGDGLFCKLPFSDVLGVSSTTPVKDQLTGMCPNGDREGLILYLQFSGESVPLNTQSGQGCNRWGWYTAPTLAELQSGISGALIVGAGGNDVSKGTNVGVWTATANPAGGVTVNYLLNPPYVLDEVHVDLACLPIDKCAPGSYTYGKDGLAGAPQHTVGPLQYPSCRGGSKAALIVHAAVDYIVQGSVCPSIKKV
ncbi:hypothetical protein N657DRAFT_572153 [Parathielavia appendiculata]|uniref:Major facilitator superfamily transporter n=1 Tax=Parathielavia appendiculata TaxID=2587402 RepID=A0AAN6U179_9PEZI|nr:hypothetical protein N657DRAFT_572153 [Parathielavia appendiculata]